MYKRQGGGLAETLAEWQDEGISIHVLDAEGEALETLESNENLGFILSDHLPFSEADNQKIADLVKISLGEKWLQGHACITIIQHTLDGK